MKIKQFIHIVVILLLVSSCSTYKQSQHVGNNNKEKQKALFSEKLGIALSSGYNEALIKEVIDWLGTPYVYGGRSKSGTDCSGFIMEVYKKVYDIETARSANGIYEQCTKVKREKLKQGELVFFKINTAKVGHVGIFLEDTYFIHASSSKGVMVSTLTLDYWNKYFVSGGKLD